MHRGTHRAPTKGRSRYLVVLLVVGMIVAFAIPAAAGNHGIATGDVYWTNHAGTFAGIHTVFSLHDNPPGSVSTYGDRGYVYQNVPGKGEIWIDVDCVKIDGSEAWWSGHTVGATGDYIDTDYMSGWFKDVATPGASGDGIGTLPDLSNRCPSTWTPGNGGGTVTAGNLTVHPVTISDS